MKRWLALPLLLLLAWPTAAGAGGFGGAGFGEALFENQMRQQQIELQRQIVDIERQRAADLRMRMQMQEMLDLQREQMKIESDRAFRRQLDGIGQPWRLQDLR